MRVLLVEDDPMVRRSIDMLLQHLGHTVDTAENASEALKKLASSSFGLVLADFYMPGMKGDELAREIKRLQPSLPVVLITGSAGNRSPAEFAGILRKPFSIRELRELLDSLPAGRERSSEGERS